MPVEEFIMGVISSFGTAPGAPVVDSERCLHCGKCAAICPVEVLQSKIGDIVIDNELRVYAVCSVSGTTA